MYYKVCPLCGELTHAYSDKKKWVCPKCLRDITEEEVRMMSVW
jgi:ribosomal protein L37AE/L43A